MPIARRTLLLTCLFRPSVGGVQNFYFNIARNYPQNDMVVLADEESGCEDFDRRQEYPIYRKSIGRMKDSKSMIIFPQLALCMFYLLSIIRKERIQHIIVGQCRSIVYIISSLLVGFFFRIPVTLFAHGEDVYGVLKGNFKSNFLMKYLYSFPRYFIANSSFTKEVCMKLGVPEDRIHVLNPCVNSEFFHQVPDVQKIRREYGFEGRKILLSVGRLDKRKGHDTILKALPALRERSPDIVYVIVGDGSEKDYLVNLAETLTLSEHVFFLSSVNNEGLRDVLSICDLFVLPNREVDGDVEGFGMVFLEANCCGKPVIGGRSGGTYDAIESGKTGFLCDPESIDDVIDKITLLLSDQVMAGEMGRYGRERALSFFNWEKRIPEFFEGLH